jgi:hypothetical protein
MAAPRSRRRPSQCLNGELGWLEVKCNRYKTHRCRSTDRLFVVSGLVKLAVFDGRLDLRRIRINGRQHLGFHLQIIFLALPSQFFLKRSEIVFALSDFIAH